MKGTLLFLFIFSSTFCFGQIEWISIEEATKQTNRQPKKMMIDVYTHWCGWCKKLDATTFKDSSVVKYANEKFIPVKFNAEMKDTLRLDNEIFVLKPQSRSHEFAQLLLNGKMTYPTIVFVDEKKQILSAVPGFMEAPALMKVMKYFGDEIYKEVSWEDYEKSYENR